MEMTQMKALRIVVALLVCSALGLAQEPPAKKALKVPLTKITVKKGALRPGVGIQGEIPPSAYQAKFAAETVLFLDLNGDDMLTAGQDGMVMSYGPFVVGIPQALLLKAGQYVLSFEGTKTLLLTPDDLGAAQVHVADASFFTEIRVRSALTPAALDAKACQACDKHLEYLKLNGMADGSGGLAGHQEDSGKPGYTPEGAAAGQGDLSYGNTKVIAALDGWYRSAWHAVPMMEPGLTRFGVASKYNVVNLYFSAQGGGSGYNLPYPPDGGVGIPRAFSDQAENPNPVPGSKDGVGCGLPIFVRGGGTLDSAELVDPSGRAVPGTSSCPAKPANPKWPTNSGCAFFIPSKPLAPMTAYKATFKFQGSADPVVWTFTTGK
jgi:hypothetical protein